MLIQIRHRWTGAVLYEGDGENIRQIVEAAIGAKANLSRANLSGADLSRADLSGANLSRADLSEANLSRANLSEANLFGANLFGANLFGANLSGADLSGANLSRADLSGADLSGANLSRADLSRADLSRANLLTKIAPDITLDSPYRRMLAEIEARPEALHMESVHACETTHCQAGWLIHFAGPAGRVLEATMGWSAAGALIHLASCPHTEGKVPNFHASNKAALAEIRRLAALEPELEVAQ